MKRLLILGCCVILWSHLPALAQNYSGNWMVEAQATFSLGGGGSDTCNYAGTVHINQNDFSPPMQINVNGTLQLSSGAIDCPTEIPLSLNFSMPDSNTIPPLPYITPYGPISIDGSMSGNSGSGQITSTLPTGAPGPLSGTWEANRISSVSAVPTLAEWGFGITCFLLLWSALYLIKMRRTV
jgi:hypothetical protein